MSLDGLMTCDHAAEAGSRVMELKLCENCPNTFVRPRLSGLKYCGPCRAHCLMPLNLDAYREAFPHERPNNKLPHYDDSLLAKKQKGMYTRQLSLVSVRQPRKKLDYGDWRSRLLLVFAAKPRLTSEEIQEVIGCPGIPSRALNMARGMLVRVGDVERRVHNGRYPGIYALRGSLIQ